jgi:pyruvate kinase
MLKYHQLDHSDITAAISHATCSIAMDLHAKAIITVSMSGFTTEMVSRYKPNCLIIGCTVAETVYQQMNLLWGVTPMLIQKESSTDDLFAVAVKEAKEAGHIQKDDIIVITAGVPLGISGKTNMVRVIEVE